MSRSERSSRRRSSRRAVPARDAAVERISRPELDQHFLEQEFEYVAGKLDMGVDELRSLFEGENKTFHDYRNKRWAIGVGATVMRALGMENRLFR